MDILTGDGTIVTVTSAPDDPNRDLYLSFPNSYGSLGYALRLKIQLAPVQDYVAIEHVRFDSAKELALRSPRSPKARATTAHTWTSWMARCFPPMSST